MFESVGKADLLSDNFDGKQSRESFDLPLTCYQSPIRITVAFRSSKVRNPLLDLDSHGSFQHWVYFLFFLRELLMFWPPVLV